MGERGTTQRAAQHARQGGEAARVAGPDHDRLAALSETLNRAPAVQRVAAMAPDPGGLPPRLRSGIEALSGVSMAGVRVHRNSSEPAQLNAHAFAQGRDIHLAPGQDHHLPHEAWHVVQQAQGRVPVTRQMKRGTPLNDDPGLEHEADMMGARAAGMGTVAPGEVHAAPVQAAAAVPVQRVEAIVPDPAMEHPRVPLFNAVKDKGFGLYGGDINWVALAERAQVLIAAVRQPLVPDSEEKKEVEAELEPYEAEIDRQIRLGNDAIARFNAAQSGEKLRIAEELRTIRRDVSYQVAGLEKLFRKGAGGFSAVGRAKDAPGVTVAEDTGQLDPYDNHYLTGASLGGSNLATGKKVTGDRGTHGTQNIYLLVNGQKRKRNKRPVYVDTMAAPRGHTIASTYGFTARGRDKGQDSAMSKTNARGYAWVTQTPGWDTTGWEWLHIRAASLGGATDQQNLVLGVADANTHMMPFESNLRQLADIASANRGLFSGLNVQWSILNQGGYPHIFRTIRVAWNLNKQPGAPRKLTDTHGTADFAPLKHDTVLTKGEVRHIQTQLKEARELATAVTGKRKKLDPSGPSSDDKPSDKKQATDLNRVEAPKELIDP